MKALVLESHYRSVDLLEIPGLAIVERTPKLIARIKELQAAVIAVNAYKIEDWDDAAQWTQWAEDDEGYPIPGDPLRTDWNQLVVSKTKFSWICYAKHSDVEISTEQTRISDLEEL